MQVAEDTNQELKFPPQKKVNKKNFQVLSMWFCIPYIYLLQMYIYSWQEIIISKQTTLHGHQFYCCIA